MRGVWCPKDLVYIKLNKVGLASYHFDEEIPYISYANPHPNWKLDNGDRMPTKKYFENCSYDAASRTFKGTIHWKPVTAGGSDKWEYKMIFSPDFMII